MALLTSTSVKDRKGIPKVHRVEYMGRKSPKTYFSDLKELGTGGKRAHKLGTILSDERAKTVLAVLFSIGASYVTYFARALTTLRVPAREHYKPLPDPVLDKFGVIEWGFTFADWVVIVLAVLGISLTICHDHGIIIWRRFFSIFGVLMLMRALMFPVTVLPIASYVDTCYNVPSGTTVSQLFFRIVQNTGSRIGLVLNSEDYCGDYIYSGHTVTIVMLYLTIKKYSPKTWILIHWLLWAVSAVGIVMLLLVRGHYTIDVVIAYCFTTHVFRTWHTMAEFPDLKNSEDKRNRLATAWWFPLFKFMEANIDGVVLNSYKVHWMNSSGQHANFLAND